MVQRGVAGVFFPVHCGSDDMMKYNRTNLKKKKKTPNRTRLVIFLSIPIGKAQSRRIIFYLEPQANKMSLIIFNSFFVKTYLLHSHL